MELQINYINQILIFVIFAVSLNLLMGYAGQVSVASAAFGALGGYATAYLWIHGHTSLIWSLLISIGVAGAAGLLVGLPALRLDTPWLILLTLAVQTIIVGLASSINTFGGAYGLQDISGLSIFGHPLRSPSNQLPLDLVVAALAFLVCWRFGESPYGRVLRAIREDEIATRALGKNVYTYKLSVFAITSAIAGVAGALLVVQGTVASPGTFSFDQSTAIIAMVIFGGMGNLLGSVLGAAVIVLATPFFQDVINLSPQFASEWRLVAYGLLIAIVMLLRPQGLIPEGFGLSRLWRRGGVAATSVAVAVDANPAAAPVNGPSPAGLSPAPGPRAHPDPQPAGGGVTDPAGEVGHRGHHPADLVLEVRGLSKSFGGIVAASDLDLDLHQGTITALVGPNGAGKTTVFNLLTGAIRPDRGEIRLNGVELTGMTPNRVARLGMVRSFQDVRIFPRLSCLHNVMLAVQQQPGEHAGDLLLRPIHVARAERATQEQASRWLEFVGLGKLAATPVGALGFGQQKLVALARVLATDAKVLLLDEPASGIDHQWVEVMLDLIEQLRAQGRTVCIVEHNLNVVGRLADRTYFMELGRITAQGSFEALIGDQRLAEAYFGTA